LGAFERDPGDDRDLSVHRFDEAFDDRSLLVGGEKSSLPGVTENDQALDARNAAKPGAQSLDGRMIDFTFPGERRNGRGIETSEIRGFHFISSMVQESGDKC